MYKLISPHKFEDSPIRQVTRDFIKTAGYVPKEIDNFLKTGFAPESGKTYLHINALGAGEVYGPNVNGDFFPETALMNKSASWGYKTFELYAHPYYHHQNKDPKRSIGSVKVAAWNPEMKRVELVLEIDNERGSELVEKVASGEYPDFSMGCKVPFDICSVCGNQAKKVAFYCGHLKTAMNRILEDGRRVCAINTMPKFFDISRVLIGADKTAKMLRKVASENRVIYPSAALGLEMYGDDSPEDGPVERVKLSTMEKEVPADNPAAQELVELKAKALERFEPELPGPTLKKLSSFPLEKILSTLAYSGVCLRPREYQTIILIKSGRPALADDLHRRRIAFSCPCDDEMRDVNPEPDEKLISDNHVDKRVFELVRPFVESRSITEPNVRMRIMRISILPSSKLQASPQVKIGSEGDGSSGLMELLAALGISYWIYRKGFPTEAKAFERVIAKKPWLAPVVLGGAVGARGVIEAIAGPTPKDEAIHRLRNAHQLQTGQEKIGFSWKSIGTVVGPVGLAYLMSASAKRKQYTGHRLSGVEKLMRDYPGPASVLGVLGLVKGRKMISKLPKLIR